MQTLNIGEERYIIKRIFKADSWLNNVLVDTDVQDVCKFYQTDKMFKGPDGTFYLVNVISDAVIVDDDIPVETPVLDETSPSTDEESTSSPASPE